MKKLATLALLAAITTSSFAMTVNFDDLTGQGPVADGYANANWSNGNWEYYDWAQPPYNATSGNTRAYSYGSGEIDFLAPVVLSDAWFNGFGTANGFSTIHFDMYLAGNLVAQSGSIDLDGSGNAMQLVSGYNGMIDRVDVVGPAGFYVMDDMTVNAVPEPATLSVLGLGIAAFLRKRRQ